MKSFSFHRLLWFGVLFIAGATSASVALAFVAGGLGVWTSTAALLIGGIIGIAAWPRIEIFDERPTLADNILLGVFALACLRAMLWVVYSAGGEWRVLSPNNVGDASLHITFIRYLAGGAAFWPESPILAGTPLAYPIGTDLFNALLACCGMPVLRGLVWVGLACSCLTAIALWRWGGAFVIAAFLFNGGLAGFDFFSTWKFEDYQSQLAWKNIFLSMFVTQRGLLYAIPAGLALLISWRSRIEGTTGKVPLWMEVLIYGTLPLFSVHAFLFFSLLLAAGIFLPVLRFHAVRVAGAALIPATVCMMLATAFFSMPSHIRWQPGWMEGGNTLWFWFHNFGVSLPLWIYVAARLAWNKGHSAQIVAARYFVWTSTLLFLAGVCVMLTPWEWDNMKVLFWSWIIVAPFLWQYGIAPLTTLPEGSFGDKRVSRGDAESAEGNCLFNPPHLRVRSSFKSAPLRVIAQILLCALLFTSGAVSVIGGIDKRHGYRIASREELDHTADLIRDVPRDERIATAPIYNHPLLLLGPQGRCGL